ncbi:hypothetical protein PROVRUST_07222 [Providencia rustigianii DSM 4541]|uniref:Uncharacterized protein n=1 Tax=Providencia rustigianii DSM 4541 TaxID=500637 RepID=D1P4S1_9GAMM|nr:hypothetical protein PROVRUST_07222 [Providencia rustigianii DSM 4541]
MEVACFAFILSLQRDPSLNSLKVKSKPLSIPYIDKGYNSY